MDLASSFVELLYKYLVFMLFVADPTKSLEARVSGLQRRKHSLQADVQIRRWHRHIRFQVAFS